MKHNINKYNIKHSSPCDALATNCCIFAPSPRTLVEILLFLRTNIFENTTQRTHRTPHII